MSVIDDKLGRIHARHVGATDGEVAQYIPELAKAEPDRFGIALATADGHTYRTGDAESTFTIQSISKPFIYGMALDDRGLDAVVERVGVEPSGDAFNSIVMDEVYNRPMNPMVNAGAIACTAMVAGYGFEERLKRILDTFGRYAGRELTIADDVWKSESSTGHRNRAIAYLELSSGMIEEPVDEHLELYFAQCSIEVTASDLAMMAATLANGGVNPVTGERALRAENVGNVLTVMATCGMYDWSGEWLLRVGLPAKSGVGGGIIAVLPGQIGVGTYAPRLDEHGNSYNGVRACEDIGREFSLHLLGANSNNVPVVRGRSDAASRSSMIFRRRIERDLLSAEGTSIVTFELQGDLYFGTTEQVVRAVDSCPDAVTVLLDMSRVERANASALELLGELQRSCASRGTELILTQITEGFRASMVDLAPEAGGSLVVVEDHDEALRDAEDALLTTLGFPPPKLGEAVAVAEVDVLCDLAPEDLAVIEGLLEERSFAAGETIVVEGEPADRVWFITSGLAAAWLELGERTAKRLRTFGAGTLFGETALLAGGSRTSTVAADTAVTAVSLAMKDLDALGRELPDVQRHLLAVFGERLSGVLGLAANEVQTS